MVFENDSKEFLSLTELDSENQDSVFQARKLDKTFIWNTADSLAITIDKVPYQLAKNEIIFLTEFHKIDDVRLCSARMIRFNKSFFCMIDQDSQVGSKGLLFYSATHVPRLLLNANEVEDFETSWKIFSKEMLKESLLKKEMLETMLKRMLILSVRILTKSTYLQDLEKKQLDIIREFNYLVDSHFLKHHDVAFYASKLNKSPKTLANLFSVILKRTPREIIHDRIMIHARRQINYSNSSIKEIAHQLGYNDLQTFSRFFRNREGISPIQYRDKCASQHK
ncbi:helix-turn-helix transcriptional regulator [Pedobacter nutrimenti]|jgi:AraC-like DNA-binding protein|uniref:AraC-like DNA-binding protein n=1 Tax=Pedobacter nutrimenti TaxID=1241337 RepID=A0A318UMT0_9SPHI|nr:helix-turn-helix domain-containing protein [Pedobacter nutrimenti]PYF76737.1 AraC-like DNA-binding protein [Pedobacter nutrimenti]